MAHRIGGDEAIGGALIRLLADDVAKAREGLAGEGPADIRIHRARQRLKRARSLLRVLRPALGRPAERLKDGLAGSARMLSGARDADAAAASARNLLAGAAAGDPAAGFDKVVDDLDRKAEDAHRAATPVGAVVERLERTESEIGDLARDFDGAALFEAAVLRFYDKGKTAMRRARTSLSTPDLHEWRKDVKDLWHLMQLGQKRMRGKSGKAIARLGLLADLLGTDHDHAMLAERLALSPDAGPRLMRQLAVIAKERRALEAQAFALGAKLYRRKPKAFLRRLDLR